jgi:hypothetical protein
MSTFDLKKFKGDLDSEHESGYPGYSGSHGLFGYPGLMMMMMMMMMIIMMMIIVMMIMIMMMFI